MSIGHTQCSIYSALGPVQGTIPPLGSVKRCDGPLIPQNEGFGSGGGPEGFD